MIPPRGGRGVEATGYMCWLMITTKGAFKSKAEEKSKSGIVFKLTQ